MSNTPQRPPAVRELAEAIRLTREYVGEELLPPVEGWSWFDALRRWAPEYLPCTAPAAVTGWGALAPCPMLAQQHAHDAHEWDEGEKRCPGYGEPNEGQPEPSPPQTAEEKVRDLEHVIERVRETVGTDMVLVSCEQHEARITELAAALSEVLARFVHDTHPGRPCKQSGHVHVETIARWRNVLDRKVS